MFVWFFFIASPFCIVFSDSSIIYSDITKPPIFRWFQPVCSDFESGRCRPCDYQPIYICESNCSVFPHSKYFWRSAHRFWKINGNFLRAGIGRWKSIYSSYYVTILLITQFFIISVAVQLLNHRGVYRYYHDIRNQQVLRKNRYCRMLSQYNKRRLRYFLLFWK